MTNPVTQADRDAAKIWRDALQAADEADWGHDDCECCDEERERAAVEVINQALFAHRLAAEARIVAWLLAGHQEWCEKASKYRAAGNEGPYLGQPSYHNAAAAIARREHAGEG